MYTEMAAAGAIAQTLEGLHYMHQNGVIHRDIKGANLMVDKTGKVIIGDFGLAKELFAGGEEHSTVGTPHWRESKPSPTHRAPSAPQQSASSGDHPAARAPAHRRARPAPAQWRPRRSRRAAGTPPPTSGRWAAR